MDPRRSVQVPSSKDVLEQAGGHLRWGVFYCPEFPGQPNREQGSGPTNDDFISLMKKITGNAPEARSADILTLHIRQLHGRNDHHIVEACFKAFVRALRMATEVDPRRSGQVPSSKGVLEQAGGV